MCFGAKKKADTMKLRGFRSRYAAASTAVPVCLGECACGAIKKEHFFQ